LHGKLALYSSVAVAKNVAFANRVAVAKNAQYARGTQFAVWPMHTVRSVAVANSAQCDRLQGARAFACSARRRTQAKMPNQIKLRPDPMTVMSCCSLNSTAQA
jgi:hypothetical protein